MQLERTVKEVQIQLIYILNDIGFPRLAAM
jgi:hypothetical protein